MVNVEMSYFNTRVESVLQVTDEKNGPTIVDPEKLFMIKQLLCSVLRVEVVKIKRYHSIAIS